MNGNVCKELSHIFIMQSIPKSWDYVHIVVAHPWNITVHHKCNVKSTIQTPYLEGMFFNSLFSLPLHLSYTLRKVCLSFETSCSQLHGRTDFWAFGIKVLWAWLFSKLESKRLKESLYFPIPKPPFKLKHNFINITSECHFFLQDPLPLRHWLGSGFFFPCNSCSVHEISQWIWSSL